MWVSTSRPAASVCPCSCCTVLQSCLICNVVYHGKDGMMVMWFWESAGLLLCGMCDVPCVRMHCDQWITGFPRLCFCLSVGVVLRSLVGLLVAVIFQFKFQLFGLHAVKRTKLLTFVCINSGTFDCLAWLADRKRSVYTCTCTVMPFHPHSTKYKSYYYYYYYYCFINWW